METSLDQFIDTIEKRKNQLDEVIELYRRFREKLDSLPPEIIQEAGKVLGASTTQAVEVAPAGKKDLVGKTSLECAKIILREHNNAALHFSMVAKEALARGYKGRTAGDKEEVEARIVRSFWAAMSRATDLEAVGKGCYRLKVRPQ